MMPNSDRTIKRTVSGFVAYTVVATCLLFTTEMLLFSLWVFKNDVIEPMFIVNSLRISLGVGTFVGIIRGATMNRPSYWVRWKELQQKAAERRGTSAATRPGYSNVRPHRRGAQ